MSHRTLASAPRLALLCCAFALSLPIPAGADRHGPRGSPGDFVARHAEELGLDAATRSGIQAIVAGSGERDALLRGELEQARRRLFDLMDETPAPDEAAVLAQAERIGAIEAELHKNRLRGILQIRELLTPAQREQLTALRGEGGSGRRGLRACRHDARDVCPDAAPGRAILACLDDRWDDLSAACRESFDFSRPPRRRH